jgi:hypothetical protein
MSESIEQTEEKWEQEAHELLAQIENSRVVFSEKSQELVTKLSVQTKTLVEDTEKFDRVLNEIADDADADLQQATQEFMTDDESEEDKGVISLS